MQARAARRPGGLESNSFFASWEFASCRCLGAQSSARIGVCHQRTAKVPCRAYTRSARRSVLAPSAWWTSSSKKKGSRSERGTSTTTLRRPSRRAAVLQAIWAAQARRKTAPPPKDWCECRMGWLGVGRVRASAPPRSAAFDGLFGRAAHRVRQSGLIWQLASGDVRRCATDAASSNGQERERRRPAVTLAGLVRNGVDGRALQKSAERRYSVLTATRKRVRRRAATAEQGMQWHAMA